MWFRYSTAAAAAPTRHSRASAAAAADCYSATFFQSKTNFPIYRQLLTWPLSSTENIDGGRFLLSYQL